VLHDFSNDPQIYCRNLTTDPLVSFMSRTFALRVVLSLVIPFAIGGWTVLLWGGLVRIFLVHHVTWSVNSICHTCGKREFETRDRSRNEWIIGLLAFGEGWHNNHHAFPRSAFHGLHWWQFDLSGYLIGLWSGLVWCRRCIGFRLSGGGATIRNSCIPKGSNVCRKAGSPVFLSPVPLSVKQEDFLRAAGVRVALTPIDIGALL